MRTTAPFLISFAILSVSTHADAIQYGTDLVSQGQTGIVPMFNVAGFTLTSVRIDYEGTGGTSYYAPFEPFTTYTLAPYASVYLGLFDTIAAIPILPTTIILAEPSSFVDAWFPFAQSIVYTGDLSRFIGTGDINCQVWGELGFSSPVTFDAMYFPSLYGGLTITYEYATESIPTGSIPEPPTLAMACLAAMMIGVVAAVALIRRLER